MQVIQVPGNAPRPRLVLGLSREDRGTETQLCLLHTLFSLDFTGNLEPALQPPPALQRGAGCDQAADTQPGPAVSVGVFSFK